MSNLERLFCAFMLVSGVCIFSFLMDTFLGIITGLKELDQDLDDGDNLTRFFGVLKRFNKGKEINQSTKEKIENFMDFKWNNDRLLAIDDPDEISKLE